jgi:hypothetical protein
MHKKRQGRTPKPAQGWARPKALALSEALLSHKQMFLFCIMQLGLFCFFETLKNGKNGHLNIFILQIF